MSQKIAAAFMLGLAAGMLIVSASGFREGDIATAYGCGFNKGSGVKHESPWCVDDRSIARKHGFDAEGGE